MFCAPVLCFLAVKEIAMSMGLHATFMAKPFSWGASNGGHTNHSLWTTDASGVRTNAFYDADSVRASPSLRRHLPSIAHRSHTDATTGAQCIVGATICSVRRKTSSLRPPSTGLADCSITCQRCRLSVPRQCLATTVWLTGPGLQLRPSGYSLADA